jgi:hypothetical protein
VRDFGLMDVDEEDEDDNSSCSSIWDMNKFNVKPLGDILETQTKSQS